MFGWFDVVERVYAEVHIGLKRPDLCSAEIAAAGAFHVLRPGANLGWVNARDPKDPTNVRQELRFCIGVRRSVRTA